MKSTERQTDVLVVGAGPVGLFTALCLSERGVRVRIVDKYRRSALHSYALALHPLSLRLLDETGLATSLLDRGQRLERIVLHRDGERLAELDLAAIEGDFPTVLVAPQTLLEAALEQRLADNGVLVEWEHPLLTLDVDDGGVTGLTYEVAEPVDASTVTDVKMLRTRASFAIGADGSGSLVRRLLDIGSTPVGRSVEYALIEFETTLEAPDEMHVVLHGSTTDVLWPIGPERGRWSVQVDPGDDARDPRSLERLVRSRAAWFRGGFGAIEWTTSIRFAPYLADRFGHGRVWLVGDAARQTSPIGVQSMNVGMHEAHDLARRIAGILHDGKSPKLLQYYNEERNREWKMLLGIQDRMKTLPNAPAWAPALAGRLVSALPASGHDLNSLLSQIGLKLHWIRHR